jgi:hypothetical protein
MCAVEFVLAASADTQFLAILNELPQEDAPDAFERSIQISDPGPLGGELVWLIPPATETDSWQTWFFVPWAGEIARYPSFRHFFEQMFQDLQPSES